MADSPIIAIPYIAEGQEDKEQTHSDGVNLIEAALHHTVIDSTRGTTPASPSNGDLYVVSTGASGAWTGQDDNIAAYYDGWIYITPVEGWIVYDRNTDKKILYDGSDWVDAPYEQYYVGGYKNKVINSNFDVWQRGTSFTGVTTAIYTADHWYTNPSGATMDVTRQSFTLGQTDVPGEPEFFLRFDITAADDNAGMVHKIEDVRTFAGETITLSFYAKADAARSLTITVRQQFGTGGSPSSPVNRDTTKSLTTSWQKLTYTVTLGSISGKTFGSDGNDSLWILLTNPNNETFTFDIAQMQLEAGPAATAFDDVALGDELARCRRYYRKSFPLATAPAQNAGLTGAVSYYADTAGASADGIYLPFDRPMRAAPTMTFYNPSAANALWRNETGAADSGAASAVNASEAGVTIANAQAAGDAVADRMSLHYAADAEL